MTTESDNLELETEPEYVAPDPAPSTDPWTRPLVIVAVTIGLVILLVIAFNVWSIAGRGGAPRTAAERQILLAQQAVEADGSSFSAWATLARAYLGGDEFAAANDAIDKAEELQPDNVTVYLLRGDVFAAQQDYSAALEHYSKGLKFVATPTKATTEAMSSKNVKLPKPYYQPDSNTLAYAAAEVYIVQEDWDGAVEMLLLATEYKPRDASSWTLLGDAYALGGDKEKARLAYEEALRFVPDFSPALAGLKDLD